MSLSRIVDLIPCGPVPKLKARLIAKLFPAIEAAVASGYSHVEVHALLVEHGVNMSLNYYYDVTYRLRKKRASLRTAAQVGLPNSAVTCPGTSSARARLHGNEGSNVAPQSNHVKSSRVFESAGKLSNSNISNTSASDGADKFNPRNSRNFDITNI